MMKTIQALSNTDHGVPQIVGAGAALTATTSVTNMVEGVYTWLDVIWTLGGALGGLGAFIGSMVAAHNAWVAMRERKARRSNMKKQGQTS